MTYSDLEIWGIIIAIGIGTYLIRFSFLGLIGDREMPDWLLRHLRYTPVAILPGLVAPLVIWPEATGGMMELSRTMSALVTLGVGLWTKNVLYAIIAGGATLGLVQVFF